MATQTPIHHVPPPSLPMPVPEINPAAQLLFVINAASGRHDAEITRQAIETALLAAGRTGKLLFTSTDELARVAQQAAQALLRAEPVAVQVGLINDRVFLVNASVGLYPQLLEDREAYKARFGRSRLVAIGAAVVTLMGRHRQLRLRIEFGSNTREITTPTLFVGNNRLQLEQVGLPQARSLDEGCIAAVMLRPIGALAMLGLMLRGSVGTLGEADTVESFKFHRMLVKPRRTWSRRTVKVAFDGEVSRMRMPLEFQVSPKPLYLLKPMAQPRDSDSEQGSA